MKNTLTKLTAAGVLTLSATAAAMAGSTTEPGVTIGGTPGAALPPGFYFVTEANWGARDTIAGKSTLGVGVEALVWSTPWKFLGGRFELAAAAIEVEAGIPIGRGVSIAESSMFNPYFGGTLAWDLGQGINVSYTLGAYVGVKDTLADQSSVIEQRLGLTYLRDGWNLSANLMYGHQLEKAIAAQPDYFNLDLTAAKNFGKWQVGAVGFYSTDVNTLPGNPFKQSQFALGALLGYNWGPVITQAYLTRDVWQQNYGGFDTRVWGRLIVPLGDPFATAAAPLFHK
jgi:hypothetical protein